MDRNTAGPGRDAHHSLSETLEARCDQRTPRARDVGLASRTVFAGLVDYESQHQQLVCTVGAGSSPQPGLLRLDKSENQPGWSSATASRDARQVHVDRGTLVIASRTTDIGWFPRTHPRSYGTSTQGASPKADKISGLAKVVSDNEVQDRLGIARSRYF